MVNIDGKGLTIDHKKIEPQWVLEEPKDIGFLARLAMQERQIM